MTLVVALEQINYSKTSIKQTPSGPSQVST